MDTVFQYRFFRVSRNPKSGKAVYPEYPIEVLGEDGLVVARVLKTLYVRKKKPIA